MYEYYQAGIPDYSENMILKMISFDILRHSVLKNVIDRVTTCLRQFTSLTIYS